MHLPSAYGNSLNILKLTGAITIQYNFKHDLWTCICKSSDAVSNLENLPTRSWKDHDETAVFKNVYRVIKPVSPAVNNFS